MKSAWKILFGWLLLVGLSESVVAGFTEAVDAYERGHYAVALEEFRMLAEEGDARAQCSLGHMYETGRGVRRDYSKALSWWSKAAESGYTLAQYFLGTMYLRGRGVPQDYILAHMWFNLAASSGNRAAAFERDRMLTPRMTAEQIAEAQRLAREWQRDHLNRTSAEEADSVDASK